MEAKGSRAELCSQAQPLEMFAGTEYVKTADGKMCVVIKRAFANIIQQITEKPGNIVIGNFKNGIGRARKGHDELPVWEKHIRLRSTRAI